MRIVFVEPYFGGSHRAFAEGFAHFSSHDVTLVTHPASFWKWRVQGGFLTLGRELEAAVADAGPFDLVVASSMTDAARLLGAARRAVGDAPLVVYMHENQLTYPTPPGGDFDATYAISNWASMAVADLVLFNSRFHLDEWFTALPGLLKGFADKRHLQEVAGVRARSEVSPVGIDLARLDPVPGSMRPRPLVLWNQRWEHDRGPDRFASAILDVWKSGPDFDLALAGERFVSDPTGFRDLQALMGDRIVHYGLATDDEYIDLLRQAEVVVSTTRQEFFGIAVTEAVYAGAFPILPNRLVYPERIPLSQHDLFLYDGRDGLTAKLEWALSNREEAARHAASLRSVMARFDWQIVAPALDERLAQVVSASG